MVLIIPFRIPKIRGIPWILIMFRHFRILKHLLDSLDPYDFRIPKIIRILGIPGILKMFVIPRFP